MADQSCSSCGKALATGDVLYNERGDIVCTGCNEKAGLLGNETRAAKNVKIAAITSAVAGAAALVAMGIAFVLAFWAAAIASVSSGVFAINGVSGVGSERFVKYLTSRDKTVIWVCSALGFAFTGYAAVVLRLHPWTGFTGG